MNEEELRLECVKLAWAWADRQYGAGYTGVDIGDVVEQAAKLLAFCRNEKEQGTNEPA